MPPTQTIQFDPAGGALRARASAGQAAPGAYSLLLFEPDGLTLVPPSPFDADFGGESANTHALPGSAARNDGRILDLVYSVALMDATRAYAVHLTLLQDGGELGTASDTGTDTGTEETHKGQLLVKLSASPTPLPATPGAAKSAAKSAATRGAAKRGATKRGTPRRRGDR
jgi:hypothetical protein